MNLTKTTIKPFHKKNHSKESLELKIHEKIYIAKRNYNCHCDNCD